MDNFYALREAYERDPLKFSEIRENDDSFKKWIMDVVRYDQIVSGIMEYRLKGVPLGKYLGQEIPFSQILILLQGVIQEYNSPRREAPLEEDFINYLKKFPVGPKNFRVLIDETLKINLISARVLLRREIKNIQKDELIKEKNTLT
ncbi:MAG: hypothetical protein IJ660_04130 [Alphaproteobacteria bacterium]|nr:hypothetical protein [Alphaproteobacteria bacterium]